MQLFSGGQEKIVLKFPKAIQLFLLRLLVIIFLWQVTYTVLLQPSGVPDKFLTKTVTVGVTTCINMFSADNEKAVWVANNNQCFNYVLINGHNVLSIYDKCNGLDLIAIYLGFIIILPYPVKRKILFSIGGIAALIFANIIRCALLFCVYINYRSAFEVNHHYFFTIFMYLLIFYGWILFTKKRLNEVG